MVDARLVPCPIPPDKSGRVGSRAELFAQFAATFRRFANPPVPDPSPKRHRWTNAPAATSFLIPPSLVPLFPAAPPPSACSAISAVIPPKTCNRSSLPRRCFCETEPTPGGIGKMGKIVPPPDCRETSFVNDAHCRLPSRDWDTWQEHCQPRRLGDGNEMAGWVRETGSCHVSPQRYADL